MKILKELAAVEDNSQKANLPALNNIPRKNWAQGDITNIIQWAIAIAGLVAVGFIVYAGFQYTASQGDTAKTKKALHTMIYAGIGLVIVVAAEAITFFVFNNANVK